MTVLAFYQLEDTPGINKKTDKEWNDSSTVFKPEALAFAKMWGGEAIGVKKTPQGADFILEKLHRTEPRSLAALAFFGHGTKRGMPSFCIGAGKEIGARELGAEAQHALQSAAPIILYCCSTAQHAGFAESLSWFADHDVYGHSTAGHATCNPKKWRVRMRSYSTDWQTYGARYGALGR